MGSELPIAQTTVSAMESADKIEVELDAALPTAADASDDCEETTPATKLLLVERGGACREISSHRNKARTTDKRRINKPKIRQKEL